MDEIVNRMKARRRNMLSPPAGPNNRETKQIAWNQVILGDMLMDLAEVITTQELGSDRMREPYLYFKGSIKKLKVDDMSERQVKIDVIIDKVEVHHLISIEKLVGFEGEVIIRKSTKG